MLSLNKESEAYMDSIFHRISVRKFTDEDISDDEITKILKAGMAAPSACNQQPWEFYAVKNKAEITALSKASPYAGCAAGAPAVIVPVYRKNGLTAPEFAQIDLSICVENMWLETDAMGLGGVWLAIAPAKDRMDRVRKILDLPEDREPFCLFPVGHPGESRPQQDRFDETRIHWVK